MGNIIGKGGCAELSLVPGFGGVLGLNYMNFYDGNGCYICSQLFGYSGWGYGFDLSVSGQWVIGTGPSVDSYSGVFSTSSGTVFDITGSFFCSEDDWAGGSLGVSGPIPLPMFSYSEPDYIPWGGQHTNPVIVISDTIDDSIDYVDKKIDETIQDLFECWMFLCWHLGQLF